VAKKYPQIRFDDQLADSLLTRLVQKPSEFDVLLCPNLYGDLVSDLAAGLVGSLGLCPSGQFGDNGYVVFEPCHGSAPDIAGKGIVNPTSQIRCAVMLLEHLGETKAAQSVEQAVLHVLSDAKNHPIDLGGNTGTKAFTDAIVSHVKSLQK
jgi:isocitrate dehydrogenase (NAD+)